MSEKSLFIAEKPSVAKEFANALGENMTSRDGYMESDGYVVTWCFGHLVTMSYPEKYDQKYKKWRLETLPFLPSEFLYEIIEDRGVKKQFNTVKTQLNRPDVKNIYVCTDSGREGEYIYRLVREQAGVNGKNELRVWINSQTRDEILRGIREAKPLSEYDCLSDSAYLRAKEDYLMGINFSRLLSIKYGDAVASFLNMKFCSIAVGRVMTCVLGMVVQREREIRDFKKTPFYRVLASAGEESAELEFEWKAVEGSRYHNSPLLYKENGFRKSADAQKLMGELAAPDDVAPDGEFEKIKAEMPAKVEKAERKKEKKNAPLLYNLAELQNECSKFFKISPDQTLKIVQELYEKKLVTYPRTDARVLSSAIAKEIDKNIRGLGRIPGMASFVNNILENKSYLNISKTKYVDDKKITDHYAIIPTGQGIGALKGLQSTAVKVYEVICRRFLAVFYPPAVYQRISVTIVRNGERLFSSNRVLVDEGYLAVMHYSFFKDKEKKDNSAAILQQTEKLRKGSDVLLKEVYIKEGETSPPKRYTTGSMILAMENAGNLIEDEELREEIKGSGIGTSATRADILEKLVAKDYLCQNKKTQVLTPSLQGELIFYVVYFSIRQLLSPKLTAGWERGLSMVAEGKISGDEYMVKLEDFIKKHTGKVMTMNNKSSLKQYFDYASEYYTNNKSKGRAGKSGKRKNKK